jgi:hypothetical protein
MDSRSFSEGLAVQLGCMLAVSLFFGVGLGALVVALISSLV